MLQDFKDFSNRGDFVDLAVAFVLGLSFSAVVTALVDRVVMPVIGLIFGQPSFDTIGQFGCREVVDEASGSVVAQCAGSIGAVVTAIVNLLLVGFVLFLVVRAYNAFKVRNEEPQPDQEAAAAEDILLLREIRDALRADGAGEPAGEPPAL